MKEYPKYTVERLDFTEEIRGEAKRKTFYVDDPQINGNQLVILSFGNEKVIINLDEGDNTLKAKFQKIVKDVNK